MTEWFRFSLVRRSAALLVLGPALALAALLGLATPRRPPSDPLDHGVDREAAARRDRANGAPITPEQAARHADYYMHNG